jgi:hypothetical protein
MPNVPELFILEFLTFPLKSGLTDLVVFKLLNAYESLALSIVCSIGSVEGIQHSQGKRAGSRQWILACAHTPPGHVYLAESAIHSPLSGVRNVPLRS